MHFISSFILKSFVTKTACHWLAHVRIAQMPSCILTLSEGFATEFTDKAVSSLQGSIFIRRNYPNSCSQIYNDFYCGF